jgi:hypothetical protein
MNGRVYDPVIGRFLSTDPVVAVGGNSQSLNPYSYVQNGTLRFTDPTGFVLSGSLRSYPPVNGSNYGPAIGNICARDPGTCAGIAGDQNVAASLGFSGQDDGSSNMDDGLGGQIPAGWASVGDSAAAFLKGFTGAAGPVTANDIHGQVSDRFQQAMDAISSSLPKGVGEPGCPDNQPDCVINRPGTEDPAPSTLADQIGAYLQDNTSVSADFTAAAGPGVVAGLSTNYTDLSNSGTIEASGGAVLGARIDAALSANFTVLSLGSSEGATYAETFTVSGHLGVGLAVSVVWAGGGFSIVVSPGVGLGGGVSDSVTYRRPLAVFPDATVGP